MATQSPTVTIDGVKYDVASLSKEARATLASLGAVDQELRRLRVQVDIARIAQQTLGQQLRGLLPGAKKA